MARAYIVLARNDLDDNLLQVLDLEPNTSQRSDLDPPGQTHYETFYLIDGINLPVQTAVAANITIDGDNYGLSSYLIDRVENTGGAGAALTAAEALQISGLIEGAVALGAGLTLAEINVMINTPAGVAGSDLDGTLGDSIGTVEEILRILAGERYKMPNGVEVETGGGAFVGTIGGWFVTRPNVLQPLTKPGGKSAFGPVLPSAAPVQIGTQDVTFNDVIVIADGGDLHNSALNGALGELAAATYSFLNSDFHLRCGRHGSGPGWQRHPGNGCWSGCGRIRCGR